MTDKRKGKITDIEQVIQHRDFGSQKRNMYHVPVSGWKRKDGVVHKPIYAFDIETDPFEYGKAVKPFACGLYDGETFYKTWGKNCIADMKHIIDTLPSGILYAHNGGKFDMFFCMDWFTNMAELLIISNRVVRGEIDGAEKGKVQHEFRDSYAIMPFALKVYEKETVDYRTFTKAERVKNKQKIIDYLETDCRSLYKLCVGFRERFGDNLTVGSTAMKQLKKLHKFDTLTIEQDDKIRGPFFYGGRVQCFEHGIITPTQGEQLHIYDLNQCYPHVMKSFLHPVSAPSIFIDNEISDATYFVTVSGRNHGAFPIRTENGLSFTKKKGIFCVTIHEYKAAMETGMFECEDILECINFERATCFDKFVDKFHKLRRDAQLANDKIGALLYKYVGNSAYGKFAQDPSNYYTYVMTDAYTDMRHIGYETDEGERITFEVSLYNEDEGYIIWKIQADNKYRYNVATGASITGAARSLLIRALSNARRPIYCDTDCIICEGLDNVPIDETKLGHWKIERTGNRLAIGGRKLYALFADTCPTCGSSKDKTTGQCKKLSTRNLLFHEYGCVKKAHKGAELTPTEIVNIASGQEVEWFKPSPVFDLQKRTTRLLHRRIKMTGRKDN